MVVSPRAELGVATCMAMESNVVKAEAGDCFYMSCILDVGIGFDMTRKRAFFGTRTQANRLIFGQPETSNS